MKALLLSLALVLSGCSHMPRMHLPWQKAAVPAPEAVRELDVTVPADAQMPIVLQYWHRNALLIDLQGVASSGTFILKPREGAAWPVRIEFRVSPGRFRLLELVGAQRQVYPVSTTATTTVVIAAEHTLHPPGTPQVAVSWGATVK
ncbi:MAG: hypothetical protein ABIT36_04770 [Steroidobacteraceae bacterium]